MVNEPRRQLLLLAGVLVACALLPQAVGSFHVFLLSRVFVYAIFAFGVDLLWGYGGILSFGQAFFFGLGAYAYALTLLHADHPASAYLAFVLALSLPFVVGLGIGYYLFRGKVGGPFFAIITLALSLVATQTAISWYSFTQGYNGITGIVPLLLPVPGAGDVDFGNPVAYYYLLLAVCALAGWVAWRLVHSPFGRVLVAIQDNEDRAEGVGYNVAAYKGMIYAVSGAFAGIAGALYAPLAGIVSPPLLGFEFSTEVLIWVLVGGRRSLWGAFIGALVVSYLNSILSTIFVSRELLLIGPLLVLIVLFLPQGLVGGLRSLRRRPLCALEAEAKV